MALSKGPPPNREEGERIAAAKRLGCIACVFDSRSPNAGGHPTYHHFVYGKRRGHAWGVCLCAWHHLGECLPGETTSSMTEKYGPSLAKGSATFHLHYGSDQELMDRQQDRLVLPRLELPASKIFHRAAMQQTS